MNETTRKAIKSALTHLAAAVVAVVVAISTFGQTDEEAADTLRGLCEGELEVLVEFSDTELCTHGPDPERAFEETSKAAASTNPNLYYRQTNLCPGDGRSGQRVHVYVGAPADRPTPSADFENLVRQTLGLAERQFRESHPTHAQKIQFFCQDDKTPTIHRVTFPAVGSDRSFTFDDAFSEIGSTRLPGTHVAFPAGIGDVYPYCGEGTVGGASESEIHFSLISSDCLAPSDTFTHELGHNLGAVDPAAPNDSGAWHCNDNNDVMCYNDGGSYFAGGGQMVTRCPGVPAKLSTGASVLVPVFDCNADDYYNPTRVFEWHNTAFSRLLTRPRRK